MIESLGYDTYRLLAFPVTVAINLVVFYISSDSFYKTLFLHISQLNVVLWCGITVSSIKRMFDLSYLESNIIRNVISLIIFLFAMYYCVKPLRFIADAIRSAYIGMLLVPTCIAFASVSTSVYFGIQPTYPSMLVIVVTSLLLLSFICYIQGLYRNLLDHENHIKAENRNEILQAEINSYNETLETIRCHRHDLRHHDATLLEYLVNNDTSKAIKYLEESIEVLDTTQIVRYCENSICNTVLRIYARKAIQAEIDFHVVANIPANLSLTDVELNVLFSNLLENAVEACMDSQLDMRSMRLEAQMGDNGLRIDMSNVVMDHVEFKGKFPISTKSSGGIGTRSIATIVERHHGLLRFEQEDNTFITRIFIPL